MKKKLVIMFLISLLVFAFSMNASAFFDFLGEDESIEDIELTLWHHEFVTDWPGRSSVVEFFENNTVLNVRDDYGPSTYRDIEQQFITLGRTGRPDVIEGLVDQLYTYKDAGLLQPLNEYWEYYADKEEFPENLLEPLTVDGELYGVPYNNNVRLLLYRKSIFEKHDLDVPETWADLVETAAYINENEEDMQGFIFTTESREVRVFQEFKSFYYQLNDTMFDVSGDEVELVATPEQIQQVLELYYDMYFEGGINLDERGSDWQRTDYGYTAGDFAMVTGGQWLWGHRGEDESRGSVLDDTGVTAIPVAENGEPATFMEVKPIMINKHSDNHDAAWELLKEVVSKDFQMLNNSLSGMLSAREDAMEEEGIANLKETYPNIAPEWWFSSFGDYLEIGVALDPVNWDEAQYMIIDAVQNVIYEQKTPEEAAQYLYSQLDRLNL